MQLTPKLCCNLRLVEWNISLQETNLIGIPMGSYKSHNENADKLRKRAEECRNLAELVHGQVGAASYQKLADAYDALAQKEEKLARQYPK